MKKKTTRKTKQIISCYGYEFFLGRKTQKRIKTTETKLPRMKKKEMILEAE